jgi:hypothetical protein
MKTPPTPLASRAEFFAREKRAWSALNALWRGLPAQAFLKPGACGRWTLKGVMNHIAAWHEAALKVIVDLQAGRWASLGASTHRFNARQYRIDRDRPLAGTRRRLSRSHAALLKLLSAVPDEVLLYEFGRQAIGWWAKYSTYGHYEEHLAPLTRFRQAHAPRKFSKTARRP